MTELPHTLGRISYGRLAAWADRRLLPAVLTVLLLGDVLIGVILRAAPDDAFTASAFGVAAEVMPMDEWSVLLLVLAAAATAALLSAGRRWVSGFLVNFVGAFWAWWVILLVLAPLGRAGDSSTLAAFAFVLSVLHVLAGLAVSHHPVAPERG